MNNPTGLIKEIKTGKIFIYPTDTIYGIGCNAEDKKAVNKIKNIKKREKNKPLSIIAPSKAWIRQHCIINTNLSKYLPGPYTLILKKKRKNFLSHVSDIDSLGVRIPKNSFTKQIQKSKLPFITTSVNLSKQKPITKPDQIPKTILKQIDYVIDAGTLNGKPSTLIINNKKIKRN